MDDSGGSGAWVTNMASDWLAAVLLANQMPGLKLFVN